MQQREKSQGDQDVVKYGQDSRSPVNPLESEGNIYQHTRQSIEGNQNGLAAQLRAYLRPDNLDVANGEAAERITALQARNHCGGYAIYCGELVEVCQHAILCGVAVVEYFLGKLLVPVAGIDRQSQRVTRGKD